MPLPVVAAAAITAAGSMAAAKMSKPKSMTTTTRTPSELEMGQQAGTSELLAEVMPLLKAQLRGETAPSFFQSAQLAGEARRQFGKAGAAPGDPTAIGTIGDILGQQNLPKDEAIRSAFALFPQLMGQQPSPAATDVRQTQDSSFLGALGQSGVTATLIGQLLKGVNLGKTTGGTTTPKPSTTPLELDVVPMPQLDLKMIDRNFTQPSATFA